MSSMAVLLQILEILEKYGIAPNPDRDQHFMIDEKMLKKMVSAAKIKPDETVLEIGAGIGNLTKLLAKKAKKVYAIEKDAALSGALKEETAEFDNVEIVIADALKIMETSFPSFSGTSRLKTELPQFDKIVSNLPYQICEALLQKLALIEFKLAVVCVPEKFAERISAKAGGRNFSVLSIKSQAFFEIKQIADVSRECFMPHPRVDSKIVRLTPRKKPGFQGFFLQEFFREYDKITKNALREALIFASEKSGAKDAFTKRSAKEIVEKMKMAPEILEKRVFSLNENEISSVIEHMKKISAIIKDD